jgi:Sec-independent protein translocase protein TatA
MEILGVGGAELVAILIIMLIVAGPKRMLQWAYILGKYTAKARAMWAETMTYLQKEFDEAGVGIELPKEPPTRGSLNKQLTQQVNKALTPVTKPVQEVLDETKAEIDQLKKQATVTDGNGTTPKAGSSNNGAADLGTWSGEGTNTPS